MKFLIPRDSHLYRRLSYATNRALVCQAAAAQPIFSLFGEVAMHDFHRRDLALASDRQLTGWKYPFLHVALGAIHQRPDLVRIEPDFGWTIRKEFLGRHADLDIA